MNVFAVATVLDMKSEPESADSWRKIQEAFRQSNLEEPDLLHFSWHVAGNYQSGRIEECLRESVMDISMISTATTGLGVFTTGQPVLYLPVSKTHKVAELHGVLWESLRPIAENINGYYDPENWIPHITLAYEDATVEQISQVTSILIRQKVMFHLRLDHIALIFRNGPANGIVTSIPFGRHS